MKVPHLFTKRKKMHCIKILDWYHANGKNQSKTTKKFSPNIGIKQPLVSAWVNEENGRKNGHIQAVEHMSQNACQTQHPEVMEMLDLWQW